MNKLEKSILNFLAGQPEEWSVQKLGIERSIGRHTGGVLDKLSKDGLVRKLPGGLYAISDKGREVLDDSQDPSKATGTA